EIGLLEVLDAQRQPAAVKLGEPGRPGDGAHAIVDPRHAVLGPRLRRRKDELKAGFDLAEAIGNTADRGLAATVAHPVLDITMSGQSMGIHRGLPSDTRTPHGTLPFRSHGLNGSALC